MSDITGWVNSLCVKSDPKVCARYVPHPVRAQVSDFSGEGKKNPIWGVKIDFQILGEIWGVIFQIFPFFKGWQPFF